MMTSDFSILNLFLNASLLVKAIMLILMGVSMISWSVIFQRLFFLKKAEKAIAVFEDQFWSGIDLAKLYDQLSVRRGACSGLEQVFQAGFREFIRLRKQVQADPGAVMEGTQRAMRIVIAREVEKLGQHIPFLATVASVSPYVGLFGTVWGIMHSFIALGGVQQATLSMVAPGIAEALIATAMGLFAAIPAVIAYNRFASWAERLMSRLEFFREEFTGILHRQAHATTPIGA